MKLSMEKRELVQALHTVADSISRRSTLPILAHVKIEPVTDGEGVRFTTTDLEFATTFTAEATIHDDGSCTTDHKSLLALVKSLSDTNVTLEYEDGVLRLSTGTTTIQLEARDVSEYPHIPSEAEGEKMVVDVAEFRTLVKHVAPAAADDDSRPVLTSVLVEWKSDVLTCVAADAFHLAMDCTMLEGSWASPVLVPARCLKLAMKRLPKTGQLTLIHSTNRSQIFLECGQVSVVSRVIEGTYPKFRAIIPKDTETKTSFQCATSDLLSAINQVYPIAKKASNITPLTIYPPLCIENYTGAMAVGAKNEDGELLTVTVEGETNGKEMEFIVNNRYAHNLLNALEQPKVMLSFTRPVAPCKITTPDRPTYVGVVMPMHINS